MSDGRIYIYTAKPEPEPELELELKLDLERFGVGACIHMHFISLKLHKYIANEAGHIFSALLLLSLLLQIFFTLTVLLIMAMFHFCAS